MKRKSRRSIIGLSFFAILILTIIGINIFRMFSQPNDIYFNGEYPSVEDVVYTENGKEYHFKAFKGQVVVYFNEQTSHSQAKQIIENNGGKILSQIIDMNYFLVEVSHCTEDSFIKNMQSEYMVDYVFLHIPQSPCAKSVHIIDTEVPDSVTGYIHGYDVSKSASSACKDECEINTLVYNIGLENGKLSTDKANQYFKKILSNETDSAILINTSYGMPLLDEKGEEINFNELLRQNNPKQDTLISSWVKAYTNSIKTLIHSVAPYKEKDFIITKSAGNNGCHKFDEIMLSELENSLTSEELEVMEKHIILVSSYDNEIISNGINGKENYKYSADTNKEWWDINGKYADRPKAYHRWVTTMDISHLRHDDGLSLDGTSFSAPLVAGNIARIIDTYDLTAAEVLQIVKKVTKENATKNATPGMLYVSDLEKEAKKIAEKKQVSTISQFSGIWIDNDQTAKLDLQQSGTQFTGYYYSSSHGGDLNDPECRQNITGTISDGVGTFTYQNVYGDDLTATLTLLSDTEIEWTIIKMNNKYLSEKIDILYKQNTIKKAQQNNRQADLDLAIERVKALWVAVAEGDVATIKRYMTPESYARAFPFDDETVREELLSYPLKRRQSLKRQITKESEITAMFNSTGDDIYVNIYNKITRKEISYLLTDVSSTGDWRVSGYGYND